MLLLLLIELVTIIIYYPLLHVIVTINRTCYYNYILSTATCYCYY